MKKLHMVIMLSLSGRDGSIMGRYNTQARARAAYRYYTKTTPHAKFIVVFDHFYGDK